MFLKSKKLRINDYLTKCTLHVHYCQMRTGFLFVLQCLGLNSMNISSWWHQWQKSSTSTTGASEYASVYRLQLRCEQPILIIRLLNILVSEVWTAKYYYFVKILYSYICFFIPIYTFCGVFNFLNTTTIVGIATKTMRMKQL